MKNIIKNIRQKLELDNPEKYIDGYYQLSKKQKIWWVIGLFLVGVGVFGIKGIILLLSIKESSYNGLIPAIIGSSLMLMTMSFATAFVIYYSRFIFKKKEERKKISKQILIILYQLWTLFFTAIIFAVIFRIPLHFVIPSFADFTKWIH